MSPLQPKRGTLLRFLGQASKGWLTGASFFVCFGLRAFGVDRVLRFRDGTLNLATP